MKTTKFIILFLIIVLIISCSENKYKTIVSIDGDQFLINGKLTYEGRYWQGNKIEGLLFNARLVQGIFDDLNSGTRDRFKYPDTKVWDPDRNTDEFVAAMNLWRDHGMLAFTLNLQGGSPLGYGNHGWINSTFDEKGNLRPDYINRLVKILDEADKLGMIVILGYFYFGQDEVLQDEQAVLNAVDNITRWILEKGYQNILIEVGNETDHSKYDHDILYNDRIHELVTRIQKLSRGKLLVSTSYCGGKIPTPNVVEVADFILIHGNGVNDPAYIKEMVEKTRAMEVYSPMPIVFNEDDHYNYDEESYNLLSAIESYASWGYFDFRRKGETFENGFQSVPVDWQISSERKRDFFKKIKEITQY